MPDLLVRPTGLDAGLIERALAPLAHRPPASLIVKPRLVLNAVLAARNPVFAASARRAGVPVLVDTQLPYLQDRQHVDDRWAALPFGDWRALTPADLSTKRQAHIVEADLRYQIENGATRLLTPYLHIAGAGDGWLETQVALYRLTRLNLDHAGVRLPVTAVLDLGWRALDRVTWPTTLSPLLEAIAAAGYDEIALAGSGADAGARPAERLADLLATVSRCARTAPVIAWRQGLYGEACIAAGAVGYETSIGWGERCDTPAWRRARRTAPPPRDIPRTPRPVYIGKLGRSIPKATVERLAVHRSIAPDLPCGPAEGCCRDGIAGLLRDARWHTLHSRVSSLRTLSDVDPGFRWSHLARRAVEGIDLAERINVVASREGFFKVNTAALTSQQLCAHSMHANRRRRAA